MIEKHGFEVSLSLKNVLQTADSVDPVVASWKETNMMPGPKLRYQFLMLNLPVVFYRLM